MSDALPKPGCDDALDAQAAAWIGRRDRGLTPAERTEFEAWCGADPRHAAAVARCESLWATLDRPRDLGAGAAMERKLAGLAVRRRRRRIASVGAGLAAVLVLGLAWRGRPAAPAENAVAVAPATLVIGPERRTLPDGSVVEYPAASVLAVDFDGTRRRVTLSRGRAHFTVVRDPARPFVVTAGGVEVRAVGTAFTVEEDSDSVDVLVTEGRVAIERATTLAPSDPAAIAWVDAGHRVSVATQTMAPVPAVIPLTPAAMAEEQAWRRLRVEFSLTPLAEVVELLNRHNRVQFALADPALAGVRLSGVFRVDEPETLVRLLERGFGLAAERGDPDRIVLRRAP